MAFWAESLFNWPFVNSALCFVPSALCPLSALPLSESPHLFPAICTPAWSFESCAQTGCLPWSECQLPAREPSSSPHQNFTSVNVHHHHNIITSSSTLAAPSQRLWHSLCSRKQHLDLDVIPSFDFCIPLVYLTSLLPYARLNLHIPTHLNKPCLAWASP